MITRPGEKDAHECVTVGYDEYIEECRSRFGDDAKKWRHVCPMCGTAQSLEDFLIGGVSMDVAQTQAGFSCIGRSVPGIGCDWTLGGLFQLHTLVVMDQEGIEHPRFRIADDEVVPVDTVTFPSASGKSERVRDIIRTANAEQRLNGASEQATNALSKLSDSQTDCAHALANFSNALDNLHPDDLAKIAEDVAACDDAGSEQ